MEDVLVIGGGVAGLTAAERIAKAGLKVILLEARERLGGRILTIGGKSGPIPIELGAEFVHGAKNAVWEFMGEGSLKTHEVPGRHWRFTEDTLREDAELWEEIQEVLSGIDVRQPDRDVRSFLEARKDVNALARTMVLEYVEGFHAADPGGVSIHSLARSEQASERDEGERQFRITGGYGKLVEWLAARITAAGVKVRLATEVRTIDWEPGAVRITARTAEGFERFEARQALVTLPIGVFQDDHEDGGPRFTPELPEKQRAIRDLAMGAVVKLTLEFRSSFWPVHNFGFIHALGSRLPTWWSDERGPVLTAWAGGPRAHQIEKLRPEELQAEAIGLLSRMFKKDALEIADLLVATHRHDWNRDPLSRGAYSYTPAGAAQSANKLAAPVENTLYFAGEATDGSGEQGTVHGAIESGRRAAREMLARRY